MNFYLFRLKTTEMIHENNKKTIAKKIFSDLLRKFCEKKKYPCLDDSFIEKTYYFIHLRTKSLFKSE